VIGIQPLLDQLGRQGQSLTPHRRFHRLEVHRLGSFPTYQLLDLIREVFCQSLGERGFF
jgi:hypothetical protein